MILKSGGSIIDLFCKPETCLELKNPRLLLKLRNLREKCRVYVFVNLDVVLESPVLCVLLPVWL